MVKQTKKVKKSKLRFKKYVFSFWSILNFHNFQPLLFVKTSIHAQLPLGSNTQYGARVRERCTKPEFDGVGAAQQSEQWKKGPLGV